MTKLYGISGALPQREGEAPEMPTKEQAVFPHARPSR